MIQRFYSNSVRINSSLFFLLGWLFHSVSFGQEPTLPAVTETVLQADAPTLVVVNGEEVARLRTGEVKRVMLPVGELLIEAYGEHPEDRWTKTVVIEPGIRRVVTIGMKRIIRSRQLRVQSAQKQAQREEEKAIAIEAARALLLDPQSYVPIPLGAFTRIDEESGMSPQRVVLTQAISMGRYEVTQLQWESLMGSNPSDSVAGMHPVESVTWFEVHAFLDSLNALSPDSIRFRLPTEAEWEFACLAGSAETEIPLDHTAWYSDNARDHTHPVGKKQPNAWGLYDMQGNVWEWVSDWYGLFGTREVTDPLGRAEGRARVIRGGSWYSPAEYTSCSYRGNLAPDFKGVILGFRIVRQAVAIP